MGRKAEYVGMIIVMAGILAGCGRQESVDEPVLLQGTIDKKVTDYPSASAYDETLFQGVNGFAYDMARNLTVTGENYFFSPYSLCEALSILDNAAEGETKRQIEDLLRIPDLMEWNMQMGLYRQEKQSKEAMLTSANSLWVDQQYELCEDVYEKYLPTVEEYYLVQAYQADFKENAEQTTEQINRWISENTDGMIKNFKEQVNPATVMSLINAVYFYGEWEHPFTAEDTYSQTFYGAREESTVDMMHQGGLWLPYYEKEGLCGVSLPYGEGRIVMNILMSRQEEESPSVPEEQSGQESRQAPVAELFWQMEDEEKNAFLTSLMDTESVWVQKLQIPKFQVDCTIDELVRLLEEMGMVDAFHPGKAEFPMIGEVYVSDASHKAKLEVDELGSRAAAVTESVVAEAADEEEIQSIEFIVDRPFLFTIQDKKTGMILFMGQINDLDGMK